MPTSLIYNLISSIFQHIIFILVLLFFLGTDKKTATRPVALLIYVIMWFPLLAIQMSNNNWIVLSFVPFLLNYSLFMYIVTRRPLLTLILDCVFSYFIIMLTSLPGLFLTLLVFPANTLPTNGIVSLATAAIGAMCTYLLLKYVPVRHLFEKLCKIPASIAYFSLIAILFLVALCSLPESFTYVSPALLISLLIVFVFASVIFLLFQVFANQKNLAALRHYRQYLPILDNLIQKVRDTQHSHNNMVQSMIHLSELDMDSEQLRSHLIAYTEDMQQAILPSSFLTLENKLLAALFYYKYCQAESSGIHMDFTIENPLCPSRAGEFELVDAAGILLDNARENSQPGDTIYVCIGVRALNNIPRTRITVENPGPTADDAFLHRIFSKGYMTKKTDEDSHGIGLHSLQALVRKYHGFIIVSNTQRNDRNYLCFELIL